MGVRLRVVALLGALVLIAAACDWSSVGFDATRGGYSAFDRHITTDNVTDLSERWRADAGNQASAPAIRDGRLFVSYQPTADTPGGLRAYDATGANCTGSAPATCLPLWSNPLAGQSGSRPPISPPLLNKGYVSAEGTVEIRSLAHIPRNTTIYTTDIERVGGSFDPATGTSLDGEARDGAASGATVGDSVFGYVHSVTCPPAFLGLVCGPITYLEASNSADAGSSFSIRGDASGFGNPDFIGSAPAIADGSLFIMRPNELQAYDSHGVVSCGQSASWLTYLCSPVWTGTLSQPGAFDGMPAVAKGRVYVPELNGAVEVFDAAGCGAATCTPSWTAHAGNVHIAPVAVTDTELFVSSDDGHLYAFPSAGCGTATCEPTWTANLPSGPHAPSIAGSVLFVGTNNGTVAAFNVDGCGQSTCNPLWSANVGAPITTAPAIADGRVFVTDTFGTIHAFGV